MSLQEKMEEIAHDVCIPTLRLNHLTKDWVANIGAEDFKTFAGVDKDPVKAFEKAQEKLSEYRNGMSYTRF